MIGMQIQTMTLLARSQLRFDYNNLIINNDDNIIIAIFPYSF